MNPAEAPFRVLLVEDNPGDARLIQFELEDAGDDRFDLVIEDRLGSALQRLARESVDVLLLDLSLPDSQGLETFRRVGSAHPDLPIVVLTGLDDERIAVATMQGGAQDYLVKGALDGRMLVRSLRYAIERKRSEKALREVTTLQSAILDSANYAIIATSPDGVVNTFNAAAERWLGYRAAEVVGIATPLLWHDPREVESHASRLADELGRTIAGFETFVARAGDGAPDEREWTFVRRDGSRFPVMVSVTALRDANEEISGYLAVVRDITERKRAEAERERLLASEREKSEQLQLSIREAHHRIKNNLQAITDLLYLELSSGSEGSALDAIRESMERIQAIALVHDMLSQDGDVRTVETQSLLENLVPMVLQSSSPDATRITLRLDVANLALSSKQSTSLALIVNELVSNAAKHALVRGGEVEVTVRHEGDDLVLQVRDYGPGLPEGFDLRAQTGVGLEVVRTLAERDLSGEFRLVSDTGVLAEVRFPWSADAHGLQTE